METQPTPEQLAMLPKAVNEVVGVYMGDQLSMMLGTQGVDQRDESWLQVAKEFSAFEAKISELRGRMKVIAETKKAYPPVITAQSRIPFTQVGDEMAREFLGDVLFSRMTASQGYLDYGMDLAEESQVMATEMGIKEGWRSAPAAKVTLESAVSSALTGALRVTHVPKAA